MIPDLNDPQVVFGMLPTRARKILSDIAPDLDCFVLSDLAAGGSPYTAQDIESLNEAVKLTRADMRTDEAAIRFVLLALEHVAPSMLTRTSVALALELADLTAIRRSTED